MLKQENKIFKNLYNDHGWEIDNAIKREDWNDMMEAWADDPESAVNAMAFGMNLEQRRQSRGLKTKKSVPTWV